MKFSATATSHAHTNVHNTTHTTIYFVKSVHCVFHLRFSFSCISYRINGILTLFIYGVNTFLWDNYTFFILFHILCFIPNLNSPLCFSAFYNNTAFYHAHPTGIRYFSLRIWSKFNDILSLL